jgi:hypothetical protein
VHIEAAYDARPSGGRAASTSYSDVAKVAAPHAPALAKLPEDCPGLADRTTLTLVLVGLTELASLVGLVRRVGHRGSDP